MKKFLLFIFLLVAVFFASPYYLPQSIQKKVFAHFVKDVPGQVEVKKINFSWFGHSSIEGFNWIREHNRIESPKVMINSTIYSYLWKKKFAFSFKDSFYYHKDKVLISDLASDIHIHQQQKTLVLTEPCSLTGRFEEEGTRAFIDHNLIPPFSSQTVSLDIKRAHISNLSLKTLSLRGSLNLYTLQCSKNNLLTVILCMLKQKPQENIPVNCGTIPFSAENGVLVYGKTPFLLDNTFEVISKGTVNLISDSLNILVGFTTDSLTKAFDLTNLPDGYIVPFSIRGSIHNPKFDTAQAIKNIAIILLLEKVAPEHRRYPKTQSF